MAMNPPSNVDPWEIQTSTKPQLPRKPAPVVRDDWEDEDEDEDNGGASPAPSQRSSEELPSADANKNRKLWEAANTGVAAPMPTLLPSRTSSVVPPPAAAFQPALRILKRPQSSSPSQNTPTAAPQESLQDKEARYAAARERIFGCEDNNSSTPSPKPSNVKIVREPIAPEQGSSPGFKGRKSKTPSSTRPPAAS
ncbi:hypothetical protein AGABI1DRAFT_129470 [Agaricus bisporus var. burnettii JB137-S8]|uniref:SUZ domain-containing protein n=1 Tax=Agaricus bisporus var. burnettii (strain JB137-S8 / ATCC MYA-4627 / FGSC 10392) TaxID=597362 RepID=K5VV47_AGABU|nr:uncharacterized protein AGABI1DRAFT_129470 [Agaricus bisporus var. burnettii JB137-S8]EKM78354.1 hypothetical protein AGABI1DRAFT_129470 [Agaricus bisporus var. burnettii JB137-S8]